MSKETTLILLKPDAIEKNIVGLVLSRFQEIGFSIHGIKMMQLSEELLAEHYSHIADQPFFPNIVKFMTSTPVIAIAFEGENAIRRARELMGPTNSLEAPAGTIRGNYGQDMMVNVCHASDGPEAAQVELKRFFSKDELFTFPAK
ncbi:nucleoside-diphosphate kinase [Verrucomicrobiaceae bacterium N1E253]|uniref:Nucleoside diphosphate kinase n=1 Tax=Oceaniferula marina TaxID=2748318 RepID=A0A851GBG8_9BACT|nr:nucleoside-diphosphate kinase [Oceaniferula marina]NWK54292.1 nucleoside-diphosphate kinase [Oceaniferula marina]